MKKAGVLITALLVMAATGASAKFGIGVRGGIGAAYANYHAKLGDLEVSKSNITGANLAAHVGVAVNLGLPIGLEIESGAQFALIGSRTKSTSVLGEYTWNRSIYTIQVPVRAGWSFSLIDFIGVYAQIGPQFTIAVGGKDKNTGNFKNAELKTGEKIKFGDNDSRRFLMDLSMHAGVSLGGFRAGVYYDLGLLNMSSIKEVTYKPSSAGISLAYFFGL